MRLLAAILLSTFALAITAPSGAQECETTCNTDSRTCIRTPRISMGTCRDSCRSAALNDRATCFRSCLAPFATAIRSCRLGRRACLISCRPGGEGPGGQCRAACGHALGACGKTLAQDSARCIGACPTGPGKVGCIRACLMQAGTGRNRCAREFRSCTAACGGSPSGAFVLPD